MAQVSAGTGSLKDLVLERLLAVSVLERLRGELAAAGINVELTDGVLAAEALKVVRDWST